MARPYYSVRTGKISREHALPVLKKLFLALYVDLKSKGYFAEVFGFECVDDPFIAGSAGADHEAYFLKYLKKTGLQPIPEKIEGYSEDDLFDVIEFLFDQVSEPTQGRRHDYSGCGMHWSKFDSKMGKFMYQFEVNSLLADYKNGFELSEEGEIRELPPTGMSRLLAGKLPSPPKSIDSAINDAVELFTNRHSKFSDRKNAVRMLADVLESLRPKIQNALSTKDEADLFNIANNFEIRHKNDRQKSEYDPIWLSWMFYFYLATIHAITHKLKSEKS